jgi:membrane-bound serine protease (ClpP class)
MLLKRARLRRGYGGQALFVVLIAVAVAHLAGADRRPIVETALVDGIIHPVSAEFMRAAIAKADADGAALIIFTLHTPGGLLDATRDINNAIIAAKTPVAVFVGPAGNRAASAGFLITIAADIAAMAPGTHIGAAHPVMGNGEKVDEVMGKKMASDTAAYARTLATQRGRNVPLVEQAVTESRSFTEQEAIGATPPLIDLVASNVQDLIQKLDGRTIRRFNGASVKLELANADVRYIEMTLAQQILSAIAHPQIAYLLLTLGTLGLTIELWSPGAVVPGVVGGICLLLAFFALQVLPVSYAGVLLIMLGFALLILEVKVVSHGLLAVGGITSLLFGSLMLIDSPLPEMQIGLRLILPIVGTLSVIVLFLVTLGLKAQNQQPVTGESGMLHAPGQALTAIDPGGVGRVATHGEIWSATASEAIHQGDPVIVTGMAGLLLTVKRA